MGLTTGILSSYCCSENDLEHDAEYKHLRNASNYNMDLSITMTHCVIEDGPNGMKMYTQTVHDIDADELECESPQILPVPFNDLCKEMSPGTQSAQRLSIFASVSEDELEDTIRSMYNPNDAESENSTMVSSPLNPKEIAEIQKRKLKKQNKKRESVQISTTWKEEEMEQIYDEMKLELLTLQNVHSSEKRPFVMLDSPSNLYRDESDEKWDSSLIKQKHDEMTDQIIRLARNSRMNNKKDSSF